MANERLTPPTDAHRPVNGNAASGQNGIHRLVRGRTMAVGCSILVRLPGDLLEARSISRVVDVNSRFVSFVSCLFPS
jgi:hypothetical protein